MNLEVIKSMLYDIRNYDISLKPPFIRVSTEKDKIKLEKRMSDNNLSMEVKLIQKLQILFIVVKIVIVKFVFAEYKKLPCTGFEPVLQPYKSCVLTN